MGGNNPHPGVLVNRSIDDSSRDEEWFFGDDRDGGDHEGDKTITSADYKMLVDVISTQHVPGTSDPSVDAPRQIPLHPDAFMDHYQNTPRKSKRGRDRSGSRESRQSKIYRRSTSHSTAPTVPSTKISTRTHSLTRGQSKSPVSDNDPQGASRTTGGIFRGRALGNNFNLADKGVVCS